MDRSLSILNKVIGEEHGNYIYARALLGQSDILQADKKIEEAEKIVLRAQTIIGCIYSENHPIIMEYNTNLVEVISDKNEEADRLKAVQISEKNLEIARKYYGEDSIFVIKQELTIASNKIAALQLSEAQENIANIRKIVQSFHDDNPRDLMNQYLFLGQVLIAITLMSTTSAESAERILAYVMTKQLEYVEGHRAHPFLEQTITNLAIFKRSQQEFSVSLQLWEQLRRIQEAVYGEDSEVIIYTYKNIGICYLALNIPDRAEEFYLKALNLMTLVNASQNLDEELLKEDRTQLAAIYFNLYLSSLSNDDKAKAFEYNNKSLEYNVLVHGPNSIQVSNGHFINSQLALKMGKPDEAVEHMTQALKVFSSEDAELKRSKDEMLLIEARYNIAFTNIYYIKGDFEKAKEANQRALDICTDESTFSYQTAEEFKKHVKDLESTKLKCEAKLLNVSSLDLKNPVKVHHETHEIKQLLPTMGLFGMFFSSATFALSYAIMKNRY